MTPEERAKGIIGEAHIYAGPDYAHNWQSCATCGTEREVAKRIRDAEKAMRDRCVKIAEERGTEPRYGKYEEDAESSAYQDGVQATAEEIMLEIQALK